MRISDWSSDVCSSDLPADGAGEACGIAGIAVLHLAQRVAAARAATEGIAQPCQQGDQWQRARISARQGNSVSVRVGIVGCRFSKQKHRKKIQSKSRSY